MPKRKTVHKNSLKNLAKGRLKIPETNEVKRQRKAYRHRGRIVVDQGTSMHTTYTKDNPSPATLTKIDKFHTSVVLAIARIERFRDGVKRVRKVAEHTMLLQFVLKFAEKNKCTMTTACEEAADIFRWDSKKVFQIVKAYLRSNSDAPILQAQRRRGRAAELFQERYGDQFMTLKHEHLCEMLDYVTLANKERGGMITTGRIQAHLLAKFEILFKKPTIHYALTKRLRLKYSFIGKPRILFTPARKRACIVYCRDYDAALKLERSGTHIIVYMDESYCHVGHRSSQSWWRDGNKPVRGRGKGSLMILVHAITKDSFLAGTVAGERYDVDEWDTGKHPTTEMVFRSKYAVKHRVKDYHDTMDGEFFQYWVENRLVPAFEGKYPGKKMILCLDNAPYHHAQREDGFRPSSMTKSEIVERLPTLPRKPRVPRLRSIKVKPYADLPAPPPLPDTRKPSEWSNFVFLDNTGEVWLIDGVDDQGFGDAVVYSRIGKSKGGTVESTLVPNIVERMNHPDHKQRWHMIGYGSQAVRFIRAAKVLNGVNKIPTVLRKSAARIDELRLRIRRYCDNEKEVEYTYPFRDFAKRYNGGGFRGTGGPKTEWLRHAVEAFIKKHYPELQRTLLGDFFATKEGWRLLFTVPYWASSQPIEQVWAYIKNYVALRWFPGRTASQLRAQIICAMYSRARAGSYAGKWSEPRGLKPGVGLTSEIAQKFINKSIKAVNKYIQENRYMSHLGPVGSWSQESINRLVLPTAGEMIGDEREEVNDNVAENVIRTAIIQEVTPI